MGNAILSYCLPESLSLNLPFGAKYEVDEASPIGTGKFSEVYLCWRRQNPLKRYALKVIDNRFDDPAARARIVEEFNILQVLGEHPGIVQLVDRDESSPNRMRFVLELCEGGELYDRVQQLSRYQENEAKVLVSNLLKACSYIHNKGIMHRDLKPENILLVSKMSNTDIKISDFGLAKISKDFPRKLPRSHSICGSDFYLAPEIIKQEEYGREIDIWSVGVITFVLMSGTLPFFHTVLHKLYRQIVERELVFTPSTWAKTSKGAQDFIIRLLQTRPGDRLTAEQAANHPWLRTQCSPSTSFGNHHDSRDSGLSAHSRSTGGSYNVNNQGNYGNSQQGMAATYQESDDPRNNAGTNLLDHAHKRGLRKEDHSYQPAATQFTNHGGHPY